jgi:rhodanese-related sulfurtransferase
MVYGLYSVSAQQLIRRLLSRNSSIESDSISKKLLIVDVRDEDFHGGNIFGAVNIPSEEFESRISELVSRTCDGSHEVVIHCMMSQVRGPNCGRLFVKSLLEQAQDLEKLPIVYILVGGYHGFYRSVQDHVQKHLLLE